MVNKSRELTTREIIIFYVVIPGFVFPFTGSVIKSCEGREEVSVIQDNSSREKLVYERNPVRPYG